jgi:hypothetical protein
VPRAVDADGGVVRRDAVALGVLLERPAADLDLLQHLGVLRLERGREAAEWSITALRSIR